MTTTVEQAIATHYIAGLHYWTRLGTTADVICQNPLGAVEYSIHRESGGGILIIHSPSLIHGWADDILLACPVQGGRCFEGHSVLGFRELLLPLLDREDMPGVLNKLAEIHGGYFQSGTRVTG